ncbi:transcription factor AP-4 isoform X2 [Bacillus rossius redtenbacheri]
MEQEKRIRREIANSNERRRMQSINAGFQSLRTLLPHHEGEKLSKAAILQQTAEYIYQLEQEKTSLLSQNCHLKRLLNQQEGQHEASAASKKRKIDPSSVVVPVTSVPCESSDEGIGSMSPEPVTAAALAADHGHEMIELRMQLDRERRRRMHAEEQLRSLESQFYPERLRELTQQLQIKYQQGVEHLGQPSPATPGLVLQETPQLQVVSAAALPPVAQTTTVPSCSRSPSPGPDPSPASLPPPPRSPSPPPQQPQRLPPALEAAIKAEPKVEVERLPSPAPSPDNVSPQGRLYLPSTSRQNLETIVEAIRHLEGDHLFSDDPSPTQEVPLALTTTHRANTAVKVEMEPFLQFHSQPITPAAVAALQQQRPGVIVVKQHT